jgi:hypothetical protein
MNKQKILISLATVALIGSTLFVVPSAYAQAPGAGIHSNFFQEFVQFISQKFGLDKTQVQTAVKDFRTQRKVNLTPRPTLTVQQIVDKDKTRLDQLVKDGKITSDQETAIITELATLRSKYNLGSKSALTPDERKTQMTNMRNEIVSWAKSQGIDSSYVMGGGIGFGGGRGFGMVGRGKGWGER